MTKRKTRRSAPKSEASRQALARKIYDKLGWGDTPDGKPFDHVDPELWEIINNVMFAHIWTRPGLSLRDREMVTLAALICGGTAGMKLHMRNAHKVGITERQIKEIIFQVMYYAGQANGIIAMRFLKEVMAEPGRGVAGRRSGRTRSKKTARAKVK
jgi:4-carboxymuconolactone decarboxylase